MRHLIICLFILTLTGFKSFSTIAQEVREYSTEGYCILSFEQVDRDYLVEYEKRLGFRPKNKLCNRVNRLISEFQPANWNYQFGQPYPGSSIYISPEQIVQIEKAKNKQRQARR